ncbi:nuclear transport factor 2 family protein (plasmid) [Rhodococcus sp. ZPP]|uniref:nuclear transport factor 2 family protein n=1 Tax=Rhodococcus sp. ZPP TaxID=2749906 RepID=UPI001AD891D3|nr:nuclear transport factor 2 family protein [Rhodococcus sp. ZPP]QTJ70525.1 nuclear transport factor 2 family protein [Rhodococcus sp. ZPP]
MTDSTELSRRIDELHSRAAIMELGAKYCLGIDRRDPSVFLSIWHEEAEYVVGRKNGRFKGLTELASALDFVAKSYVSTHHWTTNHIIEFDSPDRARTVSDSFAICVTAEGDPCLVAATYDDECERRDGQWKLHERVVSRWFVSEPMDLALITPPPVRVGGN